MRIALLDPGSDGLALAATLRGAGFDVELAELEAITGLQVDAVVLAGDAPAALSSLRALRDDGARPDVPVVLVGLPAGMPLDAPGPAFGADWVITREAGDHELVAAVHRAIARSARKSDVPGLRERTLELSERSQVNARVADREVERDGDPETGSGEHEVPARVATGRVARASDPAPVALDSAESSSIDIAFDAPVSPALAQLLLAADRRVFPHLPAAEPNLPRGEATARELVPESLLYGPSSEPEEEPALDSLTFVGAVPEVRAELMSRTTGGTPLSADASMRSTPARGTPAPRLADRISQVLEGASLPHDALTPAPRRLSERPFPSLVESSRPASEVRVFNEASAPAERQGEGDLLAWVAALRENLVSGLVRLSLQPVAPGIDSVVLTVKNGHVLSFEGPIASRTLARLDGDLAAPGSGEAQAELQAEQELQRRRDGGLLSPFREERLRSEIRLQMLEAALMCPRLRYAFGPLTSEAPKWKDRPFAMRLGPLLASRASVLGAKQVLALCGEDASVSATGAYSVLARECELAPELDALLSSARGVPLRVLLERSWDAPLLPGAIAILGALGALELKKQEPKQEHPVAPSIDATTKASVAQWLSGLELRAEDGDYFTLLELPRDAGGAAVREAHESLRHRLQGLPLEVLDLGHLAPNRDAVQRALDEAQRVLSVERWREAYRAALERNA